MLRSTTTAGGGQGDPHIHTLDGRHFLLLRQGSFLQWGMKVPRAKPEVHWQLYAHYSGHASRTHGLLLLEQSPESRAIEWTTRDCEWRTRAGPEWIALDPEKLSTPGEFSNGITVTRLFSRGENRRYELNFHMPKKHKLWSLATLHVRCMPGRRIDTKISMFNKEDIALVEGEVGPSRGVLLNQESVDAEDSKFWSTSTWPSLGGSENASSYLRLADEEGPMLLSTCSDADKVQAAELCSKHLGAAENASGYRGQVFADCVFDVCNGGGELDAELTADILDA